MPVKTSTTNENGIKVNVKNTGKVSSCHFVLTQNGNEFRLLEKGSQSFEERTLYGPVELTKENSGFWKGQNLNFGSILEEGTTAGANLPALSANVLTFRAIVGSNGNVLVVALDDTQSPLDPQQGVPLSANLNHLQNDISLQIQNGQGLFGGGGPTSPRGGDTI